MNKQIEILDDIPKFLKNSRYNGKTVKFYQEIISLQIQDNPGNIELLLKRSFYEWALKKFGAWSVFPELSLGKRGRLDFLLIEPNITNVERYKIVEIKDETQRRNFYTIIGQLISYYQFLAEKIMPKTTPIDLYFMVGSENSVPIKLHSVFAKHGIKQYVFGKNDIVEINYN